MPAQWLLADWPQMPAGAQALPGLLLIVPPGWPLQLPGGPAGLVGAL